MQQLVLFPDLPEDDVSYLPHKKCSCCKEMLPYRNFGSNKSKSLGLSCTCKACLKEQGAILKVLHEKHTLPDNHVCPICEKSKAELYTGSKRSEQPFRLDHDRHTKAFRGFICDSCNTGLGKFSDDLYTMQKAVEYLTGETE